MGCGASAGSKENDGVVPTGGAGGASAGAGGAFEMFSDESYACCDMKVGSSKKKWSEEFADDMNEGSKAIVETWGLSKAQPVACRIWTERNPEDGSNPGVRSLTDDASLYNGATLNDNSVLGVMFGSWVPLMMPVATKKKAAGVGPVVITPKVCAVDLYIKVDGKEYTDGHICFGEPGTERSEAIAKAVNSMYPEEGWKEALENGPPDGKPFATLVSKAFKDQHIVHLPLIWQGDTEKATYRESEPYGEALLDVFAKLLGEVGPGKHEWELRIAPRGIIQTAIKYQYDGPSAGDKNLEDVIESDAAFREYMVSLDGQHSAADIPALSFFFDLDVPEKLCAGGPEREAPKFRAHYAGDIKEDCAMGLTIASTGAAGTAAAECLGKRPAKAVHIILHESDIAGGKTPMASQGGAEAGDRIPMTALFLNPDDPDDPEAKGCYVTFIAARYEKKDHQIISDPKWEAEGVRGNKRDICQTALLKNKKVREAIERDATQE